MFVCILLFNVYGEDTGNPFGRFISRENLEILLKDGEVSAIFGKEKALVLIPEIKAKEQIVEEVRELDPMAGVEILLLFKSTLDFQDAKNGNPVFLYNILRSISTLKGIEYYSVTKKRMRIFYNNAYVINSPVEKKRMDDPVDDINLDSVPGKSELFAYLEDSTFGNYVCRVEYIFDGEAFIMTMQNLTQIWYTIIPLVKPRNLKSYIIIIPLGREILFYGFSCLRTIDLFGAAGDRVQSLYNRLKALYNWFKSRYE